MSAYLLVDVDVADPDRYEEYRAGVPRLIARHGGEYLVRGGAIEGIEGDWALSRVVLLRFPDSAALHRFLDDPDYQPLKALRHEIASSSIVALEGL